MEEVYLLIHNAPRHCIIEGQIYVDIYSLEAKKTVTHAVEDVEIHPKYGADHYGYDMALLKLSRPHVELSTGSDGQYILSSEELNYDWTKSPPMIRLHRYSLDSNSYATCPDLDTDEAREATTLTVIGFGTTQFSFSEGASGISYDQLQGADVKYLSNEECDEKYKSESNLVMPGGKIITDDMLCAYEPRKKRDACQVRTCVHDFGLYPVPMLMLNILSNRAILEVLSQAKSLWT